MFVGSIVALVTPMQDSGEVDWQALKRLVDFHADNGTAAIVAVGTTGESATLATDEHIEVIRRTVEYANGRIGVIGGTGANSTSEAIELTDAAKKAGVDACLLVVPYYNKPTQEGMYRHFRSIAEAVSIPQIAYNVPGRTGCDMHNDTVVRLIEIPNIIGIKDATGDVERGVDLINRCGAEFSVWSGDDATAVELMLRGGKGNISVTANVVPQRCADICRAAIAGDTELAHRLDAEIAELNEALFVESNPIPVKWALHEMQLIGSAIRLPLTPLAAAERPRLRDTLARLGLISA